MSVEKVQTQYGEVEIETVKCDSCGETVAKSDAYRFAMDNREPNKRMNNAERNGYACPICADEGPAGFPPDEWVFKPAEAPFLSIALFPIILLFALMAVRSNGVARESVATAIGAILWLMVPLLAYIYFF